MSWGKRCKHISLHIISTSKRWKIGDAHEIKILDTEIYHVSEDD
jgi:hypothetical protein